LFGAQLFQLWSLMKRSIRIGTRGSKLALWQAEWVKKALLEKHPDLNVELLVIKTKGDKILDVPLAKVGGKGLFVKEIEEALMGNRIDLAVHSMKDMPAEIPNGLVIGAVPLREAPQDVFISRSGQNFFDLPKGALIGTSSLRRAAQLRHSRPDITISDLRGNLDTRLKKLDQKYYDAIVLAVAGMKRLGFEARISQILDMDIMLPAVGQGALCIEIRANDSEIESIVGTLDHRQTHIAITAERAFLHRLEGGCQVPIAAHAIVTFGQVSITGVVAKLDGSVLIKATHTGKIEDAAKVGIGLAQKLLDQGAGPILEELKNKCEMKP
jgi:hydroxymethylbilane synthase